MNDELLARFFQQPGRPALAEAGGDALRARLDLEDELERLAAAHPEFGPLERLVFKCELRTLGCS